MVTQKISQTTLETIKELANDKIEFILSELGVDVDGTSYGFNNEIRCSCPIHGGDHPTAFCYNTDIKRWRCFTKNCHDTNDSIFGLVQGILSNTEDREVGFREAVFWLAKFLDVKVDSDSGQIDEERLEQNKLVQQSKIKSRIKRKIQERNEREKFDPFPVASINGKIKPSWYFVDKGFSPDVLEKYNVGYCDDHKKPMYLRSFAPVLNESGTMVVGVTGRIKYEKCETCGDFHDPNSKGCPQDNRMVRAFSKWQHYGFNSNSVLYNSWFAEPFIKKSGVAILTEGPKEVWWFEQHDVHNSMCIFGLNVYDYHIARLIRMGVTTVVVALDNDEKGIEAAERLNETIGLYFKLVNMKNLMNQGEDIDDINTDRMNSTIIPFLKSLERKI